MNTPEVVQPGAPQKGHRWPRGTGLDRGREPGHGRDDWASHIVERYTAAVGDMTALLGKLEPKVVGQETVVLDANGQATKQYRLPFAALAVDYFGAGTLTVTTAPQVTSPPSQGVGLARIGPAGFAVVNSAAYVWSMYGNPGDVVTVTAFARPMEPVGVTSRQAVMTSIPLSQPAADAPLIITVPPGGYLVEGLRVFFAADATVGNRFVTLQIKDPAGNVNTQIANASAVVASTSIQLSWAAGYGAFAFSASGNAIMPWPFPALIPAGWSIAVSIGAIGAADQLSQCVLTVLQ
jgi:hypothetical protein